MSEKSDPDQFGPRARIKAHFALRGSSLRQWAAGWAAAHTTPDGRAYRPAAVYTSARMMIVRHAERDGFPCADTLGWRLWVDLSAEVGAAILPPPPAPQARAA